MSSQVARYYKGNLADGEIAPDICIEMYLWEKFGWGPKDTDCLTPSRLKIIFMALEQERVTNHAINVLGKPSSSKMKNKSVIKDERKKGVDFIDKRR